MPQLFPRRVLLASVMSSVVIAGCQLAEPRPMGQTVRVVSADVGPETKGSATTAAATAGVDKSGKDQKVITAKVIVQEPNPTLWSACQKYFQRPTNTVAVRELTPPAQPQQLAEVKVPVPAPPETLIQRQVANEDKIIPAPLPEVAQEERPIALPPVTTATARKTLIDADAHAIYGHAQDYSWITGEAQKWRGEWRLRYAAVDEVDPHGGCVMLVGRESLSQMKVGEHYKLLGQLVSNDNTAPVFHIEAVQAR